MAHATDVIAYTYDAEIYCPDCAEDAGMTKEGAKDSEGNEPGVIFESTENDYPLSCRCCKTFIGGTLDTAGYREAIRLVISVIRIRNADMLSTDLADKLIKRYDITLGDVMDEVD